MRSSHVLSLMQWVGMSDKEIRAAIDRQKTPLFVNINGEDTVPATIEGSNIHYTVGKHAYVSGYHSNNIHSVESDGDKWYEINDCDLIDN